MPITHYWPDEYVKKRMTAKEVMSRIKSGQRIFIGSSCGEPQHLVNALVEHAIHFTDLEIVRLMSLEKSPITRLASENRIEQFSVRNIYQGSAGAKHLAANRPFITPIHISAVPDLFLKRHLPLNAALIQTTPPDDFGWMSLGISVDVGMAAAQSADLVIAQVNSHMPRVLGHSFIHVNDVDIIVEQDEPLLTIEQLPEFESAHKIARQVATLIEDGSTFQLGLGATPKAILLAMANKNDLGVHTQYVLNGIMDLVATGNITNRYKGFNDGKIVASNAVGSIHLYEFVHDNPSIEFYPSDYVNNPRIISQNNKMVAVNMVMEMDLTGQAAVDALPHNYFAGVSSMVDFIRGAFNSPGGKSILLIPSTSIDKKQSRIVPELTSGAVVVPRNDVSYVISEYGAVNLFGKNLQERATAMISLAHPDFRAELFEKAKEKGYMSPGRKLGDSIRSVYPAGLEEKKKVDGTTIVYRPAKPVDVRRIQEHFYSLDKKDVIARFFYEKTRFLHDDVESIVENDYVRNLSLLAITGEFGFGSVIGIGAYMLEKQHNIAEVAFSISRQWQGKGIATTLLFKLANAAKDKGIDGLVAYTDPSNQGMIKLFHRLPYKIRKKREDEIILLTCHFNEPATPPDNA
jgi:acyl-CoA hydrolase/RimJ/RimL family protein N-acetyltransferase